MTAYLEKLKASVARDPDIEEYLHTLIDDEYPINPHTLRTYCYALQRLKALAECEDLNAFASADSAKLYWRTYKKNIRERLLSLAYANVMVASLKQYCEWKKITLPLEITRLTLNSISDEAIQKNIGRNRYKEDRVNFFTQADEVKKIFTADLSELSSNIHTQETARFAVIEFLYTGKRVSEVVASKASDEFEIKEGNAIIKGIWVYSEKTKTDYQKIIIEPQYWNYRNKYLSFIGADKKRGDKLFNFGEERLMQMIAGYAQTKYTKKKGQLTKEVVNRPGIGEIVWGKRIWTHIFRHSKLTSLAGAMPLEALQEWAGHKSIGTTAHYVGSAKKKSMILSSLQNKPKDAWS